MHVFLNLALLSFLEILPLSTGLKYKFDGHPCFRECSNETKNAMTCGYNFTLESYWTLFPLACGACPNPAADCALVGCLQANGIPRGVSVVNRLLPGPAIRVCKGDRILVDVENLLLGGQETGIHWHGISQRSSPWLDGVTGVTQCPIGAQTRFRYEFKADSAGTFSWHAQSSLQKADGVFGSLIVRQPKEAEMKFGELYDLDLPQHELLLWDWLEEPALAATLNHFGGSRLRSGGILVNGKGYMPKHWKIQENGTLPLGLHELRVEQGKSYRWRIISNGVLNCPIEMSIEGHTLLVIATDGADVEPSTISSLVIHSGERWDVVVEAKHAIGSYWIKFRGLLECNSTFQLAVLNYEGVSAGAIPTQEIQTWEGTIAPTIQKNAPHLNRLNLAGDSKFGLGNLTSSTNDSKLLLATPDAQFYIAANFKEVEGTRFENSRFPSDIMEEGGKFYLPQLNQISNRILSTPFLQNPVGNRTFDLVCNDTSPLGDSGNCATEYCHCAHVLQVKLNSTVEIILVDSEAPFGHTHVFHLHGHSFRVVAMESIAKRSGQRLVNDVKRMDEQELIHRRTTGAPVKDTVPVPVGGFTIIRFLADNPGFWILETESLLTAPGMSLTIQVGSRAEMRSLHPSFPSCGDFRPPSNSSRIDWDSGIPVVELEPSTTTTTPVPGKEDPNPARTTLKPGKPGKPGGQKGGVESTFRATPIVPLFLLTILFLVTK